MVQKSHAVRSALYDLEGALGSDRVTKESKVITAFASDMSGAAPKRANLVARPASASQAREVILIAGRFGLPLVPVVGKTNLSGLTVPAQGGVILDLRDLHTIHGVDEESMFIDVEPGVTWQQIRDHLAEHAPSLRFGYSFAPPDSSALAGCLMDAVLDRSLGHGASGAWINGVEAVLSNGDRVRTGLAAVAESGCSRAPLPDLTSLFVNTFGTFGVVTRAWLRLWPDHPNRASAMASFDGAAAAMRFLRAVGREEIADDVVAYTGAIDPVLRGEEAPAGAGGLVVVVQQSASRPALLAARRSALEEIASECGAVLRDLDAARAEHPGLARTVELPVRFESLVDHDGGGLIWLSAVGPLARAPELVDRGSGLLGERGLAPFCFARLSDGGHSVEVTFAVRFDKKDVEQKKTVADLAGSLVDAMVDAGYYPARASGPAVERTKERIDQGFRKLFLNLRRWLDPGGILNPGRWPLEGKWTRESVVLAKPRSGEKPAASGPLFGPKRARDADEGS